MGGAAILAQRRSIVRYRMGVVPMVRYTVQKSLEVWLYVALATLMSGMFRSLFLVPRVGDHVAHVLSVLMLMIVVLLLSSVLVNKFLRQYVNSDLFLIGFLWVALSVSVDFLFEYYVMDVPWRVILHDYDLFSGRIWIFVLVTEFVGPWFMASNRH
jgi:hypothetical protein